MNCIWIAILLFIILVVVLMKKNLGSIEVKFPFFSSKVEFDPECTCDLNDDDKEPPKKKL